MTLSAARQHYNNGLTMDWQQLLGSVLGGGALGVVLAAVINWFANRKVTDATAQKIANEALSIATKNIVETLESRIEKLNCRIDQLSAQAIQQDEQIDELRGKLIVKDGMIAKLQLENEEKDRKIAEQACEIQNLQRRVSELEEKLRHLGEKL